MADDPDNVQDTDSDDQLLEVGEDTRFAFGYLIEALLLVVFGIGIGSVASTYSFMEAAINQHSLLYLGMTAVLIIFTAGVLARHVKKLDVLQNVDV